MSLPWKGRWQGQEKKHQAHWSAEEAEVGEGVHGECVPTCPSSLSGCNPPVLTATGWLRLPDFFVDHTAELAAPLAVDDTIAPPALFLCVSSPAATFTLSRSRTSSHALSASCTGSVLLGQPSPSLRRLGAVCALVCAVSLRWFEPWQLPSPWSLQAPSSLALSPSMRSLAESPCNGREIQSATFEEDWRSAQALRNM